MTVRKDIFHLCVAGLASAAIATCWFAFALRWAQTGWDFPAFYIAGTVPHNLLYNREAFSRFWEQHLASLGVAHFSYFMRLSIFSFLLRPFAVLTYSQALRWWMATNAASCLLAAILLKKRCGLVPIAVPAFLAFYPAAAGLISGQDNCLFLLGVVAAWFLLEERREFVAGSAFVVCLLKFNLLVFVPVALFLHRRIQVLSIFGLGTLLLAGTSFLLTPLPGYLSAVSQNPSKTAGFFPFGLRGLSLVFGQSWIYVVLAVLIVLVCCWLMAYLSFDDAFCVAVVGALMIVPYVCWYDSALLAIPLARMLKIGSHRVRIICLVLLLLGPGWRYLPTHLFAEVFILAYFAAVERTRQITRGSEPARSLSDKSEYSHLPSTTPGTTCFYLIQRTRVGILRSL